MKKLSEALNKATKPITRARGFGDTRILTEWESIVGPELARNSLPVRIKYPTHENGDVSLIVKVNSGWTTEFSYMENLILEKIATFFGARLISRLQIQNAFIERKDSASQKNKVHMEEEENPVANLKENIKDSELKTALESLGKQIRKHKNEHQ